MRSTLAKSKQNFLEGLQMVEASQVTSKDSPIQPKQRWGPPRLSQPVHQQYPRGSPAHTSGIIIIITPMLGNSILFSFPQRWNQKRNSFIKAKAKAKQKHLVGRQWAGENSIPFFHASWTLLVEEQQAGQQITCLSLAAALKASCIFSLHTQSHVLATGHLLPGRISFTVIHGSYHCNTCRDTIPLAN